VDWAWRLEKGKDAKRAKKRREQEAFKRFMSRFHGLLADGWCNIVTRKHPR
jgi:hypothetical protein